MSPILLLLHLDSERWKEFLYWFDLPIQLFLLQQASELVIDWSIDLQVLFWAVLVFYFEVFIISVRITSKFLVFGNWFIECRSIMFPLSIYSQYSILGASSSAFNSGQYSILANIRAARGENCKYCQKYLNLRWISCAGTSFVGEGASPIPTNSVSMAFDFDQEWLQQSSIFFRWWWWWCRRWLSSWWWWWWWWCLWWRPFDQEELQKFSPLFRGEFNSNSSQFLFSLPL